MPYDYGHEDRCRQIVTLLTYSKVGPLRASSIAINLGTSEDEIRAPLESLLHQGRIVQSSDERLTSASVIEQGVDVAFERFGDED